MYLAMLLAAILLGDFALGAQTVPTKHASAQPTPSKDTSPTLEETLNWLTTFLETATGAKRDDDKGFATKEEMSLHVIDGCQIDLQLRRNDWSPDGSVLPSSKGDEILALSNIDPASVAVQDSTMLNPPRLSVVMTTRNHAKLVKDNLAGNIEKAEITSFVDLPSANRAANAFRHAAELCANTQPF